MPSPSTTHNRPAIAPIMRLQAAANASEYELLIYGDIGESWWGESVTAKSVVEQLNALDASVTQINARINSYGGSVSDGLAIYNALKRMESRGVTVVVSVDGVAMSSASLIAMAGSEIVMGDASLLMIHAPWGGLMGNAKDMREYAVILDTYADAMAGAYVAKSGKDRADVMALLTDGQDHYYTGEQAVAEGFADRLVTNTFEDEPDENAKAFASGLLSRFLTRAPANVAQHAIAAALRGHQVPAASTAVIPASTPISNGESSMPNTAPTAPNAAPVAASPADAQAAAIAAVAQRNTEINAALADIIDIPGIRDLQMKALSDPAMTLDSVKTRALALCGAQAQPAGGGNPRIDAGLDSRDKYFDGVSNAVLARGGLAKLDAGNPYAGIRLSTIVRDSLRAANVGGVDRMSPTQLADKVFASLGNSDFPLLIANTSNKALRAAYQMAPQTWSTWCARGEVSDFKANSRIQLGTFNSLAEIKPGGEYTYGNTSEEAESIIAITKGKGLSLTRQLIINDDLGAFIAAARMMGFAAARTVNEDAYARLFASTAMADTGALFNATAVTTAGGHANYTSSGTAISATSLSVGETAMALQKDASLRTPLNLAPRFLLVPRAKRRVAFDVLKPFGADTAGSSFVQDLGLTIVSDAQLDSNSGTAWYLIADQNQCPVIEVDFLDGIETPYVAEAVDWDTDAMKFKVRLDYGVQAIDWRGGYKNAGA